MTLDFKFGLSPQVSWTKQKSNKQKGARHNLFAGPTIQPTSHNNQKNKQNARSVIRCREAFCPFHTVGAFHPLVLLVATRFGFLPAHQCHVRRWASFLHLSLPVPIS